MRFHLLGLRLNQSAILNRTLALAPRTLRILKGRLAIAQSTLQRIALMKEVILLHQHQTEVCLLVRPAIQLQHQTEVCLVALPGYSPPVNYQLRNVPFLIKPLSSVASVETMRLCERVCFLATYRQSGFTT